jgi:hypothetical protein
MAFIGHLLNQKEAKNAFLYISPNSTKNAIAKNLLQLLNLKKCQLQKLLF